MKPARPVTLLLLLLMATAAVAASCGPSDVDADDSQDGTTFGYGGFANRPEWPSGTAGTGTGGQSPGVELPCQPPKGVSQPARSSVTSEDIEPKSRVVFTADLFNAFRSHCGGCHVDTTLGGFEDQKVTFENFPVLVTAEALAETRTDDPTKFMPPPVAGGIPWSQRQAPDAILELMDLLDKWIAAGSPSDLFFVEPEGGSSAEQYLMTPDQGAHMTNIGNCLPDKAWFAKETDESEAMDALFASAMELPKRLEQTDLTTWDHAELAYRGLFAFAPAYPLFSDHAGKIRHVRVPRGTSIEYDATTNEFRIPENTRFYKTFLKKVVDADGNESFRKIETRLIVSREDTCDGSGCQVRALYGTYAWNEAETEAVLVEDPLRNGEPFRDRVLTYFTDEQAAAEAGGDAEALAAVSRHYAIPGSVRCVQCHMGSPNKSFILGFSPVQVHRRPYVEEPDLFADGSELLGHGVLEEDDPSADELTQLPRLIELGVVTGIDDPQSLLGLRDLGAVPARNGYELEAQGYMLGNCSGCHNPRGFPSVKHPELRELLDFYPTKDGGGVYQFPLERKSPRVFRSRVPHPFYDEQLPVSQVPKQAGIPYITPSIYDMPVPRGDGVGKCVNAYYSPTQQHCVEAPWRSLIYRNVDTPFTYAEDEAIFPHMPRHAAGFDCRAPRIMGNWMLSIPSIQRDYVEMKVDGFDQNGKLIKVDKYYTEDRSPLDQPRLEPSRKSGQFEKAVEEARERIASYQAGDRYSYCPDQSDIQDPRVLAGTASVPPDENSVVFPDVVFIPWFDGVPDRAHWLVLDSTDVPGDWAPRRGDWADILLGEDPDKLEALDPAERTVVETLAAENIAMSDDFRAFALEPRPFGFWQDPEGECREKLEQQFPSLISLPPEDVPNWAQAFMGGGSIKKELPLYMMSPGAAVFQNICRNCHGPRGDGDSALAATIAEITGGGSRVANLEAGLFGPKDDPGTGRLLVFDEPAEELGIQPDDLALRYMLWMALGGTDVEIPAIALKVVDRTSILGEARYRDATEPSANMLNAALTLCDAVLPRYGNYAQYHFHKGRVSKEGQDPLIAVNGDAELWMNLCARDQGTLVRVLEPSTSDTLSAAQYKIEGQWQFIAPDVYGISEVATPNGVTVGVPAEAADAWCIRKPTDPTQLAEQDAYLAAHPLLGSPVPYCPEEATYMPIEQVDRWVRLGAMNAGKAVFAYLDAVAKGEITPQLGFDECHRLAD